MSESNVQAICAVCQRPILREERVVSILRNVEQFDNEMAIVTSDSVVLASLCVSCGERFPAHTVQLICAAQPPVLSADGRS